MAASTRATTSGLRVAVLASGAGSTFAALLDAGETGDLAADIALLIASRAGAEALSVASRRGVAHVVLDENNLGADAVDAAMRETLHAHRIELAVLAGYTRKIGPRTLAAYPGRILNTHPAPLPRFGGQGMYGEHVHEAVLAAGVAESAATVHLIDAEYDTGPVIASQAVPVERGDDVSALRARVRIAERALLIRTLNEWGATQIRLEELSEEDVDAVLGWRYDGEYAAYNLAPSYRSSFAAAESTYLAIRRRAELTGFVCLGAEARVAGMTDDPAVLDFGVGIRPGLTGRGESQQLMPAVVDAVDRRSGGMALRAVITAWNQRAQRVATRAGFKLAERHKNTRGEWAVFIRPARRITR